jgi:hypothetical protein
MQDERKEHGHLDDIRNEGIQPSECRSRKQSQRLAKSVLDTSRNKKTEIVHRKIYQKQNICINHYLTVIHKKHLLPKIIAKAKGVFCRNEGTVPIFLKKPFLKFTSRGDKVLLALFAILTAAAVSLFWLTDDSLAVMSSGDYKSPESLFGLVSRWA